MFEWLLEKNRKETLLTGYLVVISMVLLALRLKITQDSFFLFLGWNLLLSLIPWCIAHLLAVLQPISKMKYLLGLLLWLLWLPNTPYLITDFIHLKKVETSLYCMDIAMLFSFTVTGLWLYTCSFRHMKLLGTQFLRKKTIFIVFGSIPFLCGLGVYLGRFERWNSWNLATHPLELSKTIALYVIHPTDHLFAWSFSIGFGIFLLLSRFFIDLLTKIRT
ncbi:MAG TPA: DUF1361 domain-containing protein [Flavobacteriaceae bacterium]|nr:DUF1361 domain-containing protein [Flavobacteriaceae bacterium]HPF11896.1 DUF1361 domain-containing protein [Flavobacteriaceae bacterium]HQU21173.1 DUF1361 domain-containing protein [Flavobacteriaceae bacterium]HQU65373.1 DUF1361 domain-containing protein [Flavobacteriaceae bacterium]HRW45436.1 DUF1361 domain-containing protein [Flavobacteriaceae bacterium]